MNKYDFDFKKIDDVLNEVLGIKNPTDIVSLKLQIYNCLDSLSKAIDKKAKTVPTENRSKAESQKKVLEKEIEKIKIDTDLEAVLRKCIIIKYLTLLSLDVKVRPKDSNEERAEKISKRNEIYAVTDLVRSTPSIVNLMNNRNDILANIEYWDRKIKFDKSTSVLENKNSYPPKRIDIIFKSLPEGFTNKNDEVLKEAGIYVYNFGKVNFYMFPNDNGEYNNLVSSKDLVGIIKKNEFGELKKYHVLMDFDYKDIPPEFYRDIMFSDMLLRNSQENLGYLGMAQKNSFNVKYGYNVSFKEIGIKDLLNAIYFEENKNNVATHSNLKNIISLKDAYDFIDSRMEIMMRELFPNYTNDGDKNRE